MIGYKQWENLVIPSILESRRYTCTLQDFFSAPAKFKQDYEPDSLKCIQASISRYLNDGECLFIANYENRTATPIFVQSTVTNNNSITP